MLGYEVGTGKGVKISLSHLIATGITQLSGKTTTLEALIKRSGLKAIVFKTKVGETGFTEGTIIPPYFFERSDWQYVQSLLEATLKERLKFERAWIIEVCKNANSLLEVKANIDKKLAEGKLTSLSRSIYTTLQAYFELVLPQLQYANFSRTLEIRNGINIMDLERFKEEIQSLVIRSVLETILHEHKNTIVVMPEAWKFLPQGRGNPAKHIAEAFIRQGAASGNYLWFDCQDLAGVDKGPIKQVSTWVLGLQQERNEVKHTLDQIALPSKMKPKEDEIMTLSLGHFIVTTPKFTTKVYVQPGWLDSQTAKKIALGEIRVEDVEKPESLVPFTIQPEARVLPDFEAQKFYARTQKDLVEIRTDFFNKIDQQNETINKIAQRLNEVALKSTPNLDEIVSLVLQKTPQQKVNREEIIKEVLARIPKMQGIITYQVTPIEKLQKDFLEASKTQILSEIQGLDEEEKRILKFVEALGKSTNTSEIMEKGLFLNPNSGSRSRILKKLQNVESLNFIRKDQGGHIFPNLKKKLQDFLSLHQATEPEIDQVYNHIIMELL